MTTTPRLRAPERIITSVTDTLGGPPAESLVLLPIDGRTSAAIIRIDLPGPRVVGPDRVDLAALDAFASQALGYALRVPGTDGLIVIVFRERGADLALDGPLLESLHWAAGCAGAPVTAALWCGAGSWGEFGRDVDESGDDPSPRPLRGGARAEPVAGPPFVRYDAIELPEAAAPALRERVVAAVAREPAPPDDVTTAFRSLIDVAPEGAASADPVDVALVLAAIRTTAGRERILAAIAFRDNGRVDLGDVWCALCDAVDDDPIDWASRPAWRVDHAGFRTAVAAFEMALSLAPDRVADLAALISWCEWAAGRSTRSSAWARLATERDPLHDLASLVAWMTDRGVVPPWFGELPESLT